MWHKFVYNVTKLKPRRQYSVEGYVMDFYCPEKRLAIELEGKIHQRQVQQKYDKYRFQHIKAFGIKIIRFQNEEIYLKVGTVIERIKLELSSPP